jgi:chromosome segregation ATPase
VQEFWQQECSKYKDLYEAEVAKSKAQESQQRSSRRVQESNQREVERLTRQVRVYRAQVAKVQEDYNLSKHEVRRTQLSLQRALTQVARKDQDLKSLNKNMNKSLAILRQSASSATLDSTANPRPSTTPVRVRPEGSQNRVRAQRESSSPLMMTWPAQQQRPSSRSGGSPPSPKARPSSQGSLFKQARQQRLKKETQQ